MQFPTEFSCNLFIPLLYAVGVAGQACLRQVLPPGGHCCTALHINCLEFSNLILNVLGFHGIMLRIKNVS